MLGVSIELASKRWENEKDWEEKTERGVYAISILHNKIQFKIMRSRRPSNCFHIKWVKYLILLIQLKI